MRSRLCIAPCIGAVLLLARLGVAQQVFVVAPTMERGVFATQIQPAIDASTDGDIVLVRAGTYEGFSIRGKSVSVGADVGSLVMVPYATVTSIGRSQPVVLHDLKIGPRGTRGDVNGVTAKHCDGSIWIEGCYISATGSFGGDALTFFDCNSVALLRSTVFAGNDLSGMADGGVALRSQISNVTLYDSTLQGGTGGSHMNAGSRGGSGALIIEGSFFASGSKMLGGHGGRSWGRENGARGGDGVLASGQITVLDSVSIGGVGGASDARPGPDGEPFVIVRPGTLTNVRDMARHFEISSPVREMRSMSVYYAGLPGEFANVLVSPSPVASPFDETLGGVLLVSMFNAEIWPLGIVPREGSMTVTVQVPQLPPAALAETLFLQSMAISADQSTRSLGPASALLVLHSAF